MRLVQKIPKYWSQTFKRAAVFSFMFVQDTTSHLKRNVYGIFCHQTYIIVYFQIKRDDIWEFYWFISGLKLITQDQQNRHNGSVSVPNRSRGNLIRIDSSESYHWFELLEIDTACSAPSKVMGGLPSWRTCRCLRFHSQSSRVLPDPYWRYNGRKSWISFTQVDIVCLFFIRRTLSRSRRSTLFSFVFFSNDLYPIRVDRILEYLSGI